MLSSKQRKVSSFARAVTLSTKRRSNHESCIHPFPFLLHTPVARCVNGERNCLLTCMCASSMCVPILISIVEGIRD